VKKVFSVIGGDRRQRCLSRLLRDGGHQVLTACLGAPEDCPVDQAAKADIVILPLPVSRDGTRLNTPLWEGELALDRLLPLLRGGEQKIFGGNISPALAETFRRQGLVLEDYYAREEVQIALAVATAEGAVAAAIAETERTLHRMPCLVIGYGRIGKVLSHRLAGLGAEVTVAARRLSDLAWIDAYGYTPLPTGDLAGRLGQFELIFNTVPVPLLCRARLEELRPDCLVVDLASEPGGLDYRAAKELDVRTVWAKGLPGKTAPVSAAAVVRDAVYHILEERGEPI